MVPPIAFLVLLLIFIPRLPPSNSSPNLTLSIAPDPFGLPYLMEQQHKKLRRAPHVFSKVLQLPLNSNSDVSVEDLPDCFKFTAEFDCPAATEEDLTVLIVEPHPEIKKVLVRYGADAASFDDINVHVWRARLPQNTSPEAAKATFHGGRLVVTVPKITVSRSSDLF